MKFLYFIVFVRRTKQDSAEFFQFLFTFVANWFYRHNP